MFKLIVVILCFATLLVTTGSALQKDEYEISIKHGPFSVHQRHVNVNSQHAETEWQLPGSAGTDDAKLFENSFGKGKISAFLSGGKSKQQATRGQAETEENAPTVPNDVADSTEAPEKISTEAPPGDQPAGAVEGKDNFSSMVPNLEGIPLQENIFQRVDDETRETPNEGTEAEEASTTPIAEQAADSGSGNSITANDFYKAKHMRLYNSLAASVSRGPVLFSTPVPPSVAPTAGNVTETLAMSSNRTNDEIYLLLKYDRPQQKIHHIQINGGQSRVLKQGPTGKEGSSNDGDVEFRFPGNFRKGIPDDLKSGVSLTTVGYYVNKVPKRNRQRTATTADRSRTAAADKLRNSYGDYVKGDLGDFESAFNAEQSSNQGDRKATQADIPAEELRDDMDIVQLTRALARRRGGLTIAEFNRYFKDYLSKEITADDLSEFSSYKTGNNVPVSSTPASKQADNGKQANASEASNVPNASRQPTAGDTVPKLKAKSPRKEKVVKIGYGGSKSFQGVYKSQRFLEKVKPRLPEVVEDASWLPSRMASAMGYVDNPVFNFAKRSEDKIYRVAGQPFSSGHLQGGHSYVKFQKFS